MPKKKLTLDPQAVFEAIVDPRRLECFARAGIRFGGMHECDWQKLDEQNGKRVEVSHGRYSGTHWIFLRLYKYREDKGSG